MIYEEKTIETIPVGPLGLVPLKSCTELGKKVNDYLVTWRRERESEHKHGRSQDNFCAGHQVSAFAC